MNQIGMYSVITHTIHSLRPSPTKADATIRHFTDFIMLDIDVPYISRSNGKTSPIFIAYFREIAVIDLLLCAYFPTISRIGKTSAHLHSQEHLAMVATDGNSFNSGS